MILALDTATTSGFAYGEPGGVPVWGARAFGKPGRSNGEINSTFGRRLTGLVIEIRPSLIAFEAPWVGRKSSTVILRRLMSLAGEEVMAETTVRLASFYRL